MTSWLDKPGQRWSEKTGSLNWVNKGKLSANISNLAKNIHDIKEKLISLLSLMDQWESNCKWLSELSKEQLLTAKHILDLKPLLEKSEDFKTVLGTLLTDDLKALACRDEENSYHP